MSTALAFYNKLRVDLPFLGEEKRIKDCQIMLLKPQEEMLHDLFLALSKKVDKDIVKHLIVDVLQNPGIDNGKVYEALVYAWLEKQRIPYTPQSHVSKDDCFKRSSHGYDADGIINMENSIIFDVKQFGLTLPHIESLRRKLQAILPEEYYLTISSVKNISVKEFEAEFLRKVDDIAKCIMDERNRIHTDYIYREKKYGFMFRAWNRKNHSICTSMSNFDRYEWAQNNEFYFMYHASQFCIKSPYMLFCPFDKQLAPMFSNKNDESALLSFRALCRRIFINLVKMENKKISSFDGKARNDVSVATAAKKISAIVFVDVSEYFCQHCSTYVFQNPNADNKITESQVKMLFGRAEAAIDDFKYDNY